MIRSRKVHTWWQKSGRVIQSQRDLRETLQQEEESLGELIMECDQDTGLLGILCLLVVKVFWTLSWGVIIVEHYSVCTHEWMKRWYIVSSIRNKRMNVTLYLQSLVNELLHRVALCLLSLMNEWMNACWRHVGGQGSARETPGPRMTRQHLLTLIAMASINFSSMICYSILGPFFPNEVLTLTPDVHSDQ